jgi:hypothetical protein
VVTIRPLSGGSGAGLPLGAVRLLGAEAAPLGSERPLLPAAEGGGVPNRRPLGDAAGGSCSSSSAWGAKLAARARRRAPPLVGAALTPRPASRRPGCTEAACRPTEEQQVISVDASRPLGRVGTRGAHPVLLVGEMAIAGQSAALEKNDEMRAECTMCLHGTALPGRVMPTVLPDLGGVSSKEKFRYVHL